jgi:lysophospholipase L1-like esterase
MRPLIALLALVSAVRADFALKDGDTLAFLGDSITAARGYTKIVEHYTLMRFPDRKVRFVNAGEGGDTAQKCLARLDRDVFAKGATVVTVAYGINDIGWGTKADDKHKQLYLDGLRIIIERCREKKVRPIICSPAITAEDPDTAEKAFLQTMTTRAWRWRSRSARKPSISSAACARSSGGSLKLTKTPSPKTRSACT